MARESLRLCDFPDQVVPATAEGELAGSAPIPKRVLEVAVCHPDPEGSVHNVPSLWVLPEATAEAPRLRGRSCWETQCQCRAACESLSATALESLTLPEQAFCREFTEAGIWELVRHSQRPSSLRHSDPRRARGSWGSQHGGTQHHAAPHFLGSGATQGDPPVFRTGGGSGFALQGRRQRQGVREGETETNKSARAAGTTNCSSFWKQRKLDLTKAGGSERGR